MIQQASNGCDYERIAADFDVALQALETANTLAPSNRFIRTEYLMALTYALELAEEQYRIALRGIEDDDEVNRYRIS